MFHKFEKIFFVKGSNITWMFYIYYCMIKNLPNTINAVYHLDIQR